MPEVSWSVWDFLLRELADQIASTGWVDFDDEHVPCVRLVSGERAVFCDDEQVYDFVNRRLEAASASQ
jgi:hypothetical protein